MNIFIDFHHYAKMISLHKLFVDRFDWNMYIPSGLEWFESGYWYLFGHFSYDQMYPIAKQFLTLDSIKNMLKTEAPNVKFITFDDFKNNSNLFDVVIPTVPHHYTLFSKLIQDFGMRSKIIFCCGNNFYHEDPDLKGVSNILASSKGPYHFINCHKIFYHQEFDLQKFKPSKSCNIKSIVNFQHCMDRKDDFLQLEKMMPDWEFKAYGANNRDGNIPNFSDSISDEIKKFGFVWHVKETDEGYGHVIHNAFACGKPVLVDTEFMTVYYDRSIKNTASLLFTSDTIIDVNKMSLEDIKTELEKKANNYDYYSQKTYDKFKEVVNFDKEFDKVKLFFEHLTDKPENITIANYDLISMNDLKRTINMRLGVGDYGQYHVNDETLKFWVKRPPYNGSLDGFVDMVKYLQDLDIKTLVEIGCFQGESTTIFAHYLPNCEIYAVDPFIPHYDDSDQASLADMSIVESNFDNRISKFKNINKMRLLSNEASKIFENESIDMVYIDGNHLHNSVVSDLELWVPKIKPKKYIAGHDYGLVLNAIEEVIGGVDKTFTDSSWIKQLQ